MQNARPIFDFQKVVGLKCFFFQKVREEAIKQSDANLNLSGSDLSSDSEMQSSDDEWYRGVVEMESTSFGLEQVASSSKKEWSINADVPVEPTKNYSPMQADEEDENLSFSKRQKLD